MKPIQNKIRFQALFIIIPPELKDGFSQKIKTVVVLHGLTSNMHSSIQKRFGFPWEALSLKHISPSLPGDSRGDIPTTGLNGEAF